MSTCSARICRWTSPSECMNSTAANTLLSTAFAPFSPRPEQMDGKQWKKPNLRDDCSTNPVDYGLALVLVRRNRCFHRRSKDTAFLKSFGKLASKHPSKVSKMWGCAERKRAISYSRKKSAYIEDASSNSSNYLLTCLACGRTKNLREILCLDCLCSASCTGPNWPDPTCTRRDCIIFKQFTPKPL